MITEEMSIVDILELSPEMEKILFARGLNCAGCPGSYTESLREAAAGHGVDLNALLKDLNERKL